MTFRPRWTLCAVALLSSACFRAPASPKLAGNSSSGSSGSHASSSGSTGASGSSGTTSGSAGSTTASHGSTAGTASGSAGSASGSAGTTTATTGATTSATTTTTSATTGTTSAGPTAGSTGGTTSATAATASSTGAGTTGATTSTVATASSTGGVGTTGTAGTTTGSATSGSSGTTGAVPGNDTCAGTPATINAGDTVTGDTTNATNDYGTQNNNACLSGGGNRQSAGPDVVYSFTTQTAGAYPITLTPNGNWDAVLYVAPLGACGSSGISACTDFADQNGAGQAESLTLNAQAGVTYGIFVDGFQANDEGAYTLSVQAPAQPACSAPTALALVNVGDITAVNGDTSNQADNSSASGCNNAGNGSPDVVYSFTPAAAATLNATATAANGSQLRPVLYLQTSCADNSTELACNASNFNADATLAVHVEAGTTYYLWVDGTGFQASSGAFTLTASLVADKLGDACATVQSGGSTSEIALTATSGGALVGTTQVDTTGYTDDSQASGDNGCFQGQGQGPDRVYQVLLAQAVSSLTAQFSGTGILYLRAAPCSDTGTDLACNGPFNGSPTFTTGALAAGTYYLWVDSRGGQTAQGTLTVTAQP